MIVLIYNRHVTSGGPGETLTTTTTNPPLPSPIRIFMIFGGCLIYFFWLVKIFWMSLPFPFSKTTLRACTNILDRRSMPFLATCKKG